MPRLFPSRYWRFVSFFFFFYFRRTTKYGEINVPANVINLIRKQFRRAIPSNGGVRELCSGRLLLLSPSLPSVFRAFDGTAETISFESPRQHRNAANNNYQTVWVTKIITREIPNYFSTPRRPFVFPVSPTIVYTQSYFFSFPLYFIFSYY